MEELKRLVYANKGENIRSKEWLNEAIHWIEHTDLLISLADKFPCSEEHSFFLNDIIYNYCSIFNWLAIIKTSKEHVSNNELSELLIDYFEWPEHVAKSFIRCIRNPVAHMGRQYLWNEYKNRNFVREGNKANHHGFVHPNLKLDHNFRMKNPEFKTQVTKYGWIDGGPFPDNDNIGEHFVTEFYIPGIRSRLLKAIERIYLEFLEKTEDELKEFEELDIKLTLTRMPAPENCL